MKLTKSKLKQLIKEELYEGYFEKLPGVSPEVKAAYQHIGHRETVEPLKNGDYKLEHVAEALRIMAKKFDEAAEKEKTMEAEVNENN